MSEGKNRKMNISTVLLIIAILIIAVMAFFMYKIYSDKLKETQRADELNEKVSAAENQVNILQEKIDSINNVLNPNAGKENINITSQKFSDEEVKETLSNYLKLSAHRNCNELLNLLKEMNEINYDGKQYGEAQYGSEDEIGYKTNIKYLDYKNAMLKYISENEFNKNWNSYYGQTDDGYLVNHDGGGDMAEYSIVKITKTEESKYTAETTYVIDESEDTKETENYDFTITENNGKCVIESIEKK